MRRSGLMGKQLYRLPNISVNAAVADVGLDETSSNYHAVIPNPVFRVRNLLVYDATKLQIPRKSISG
jgi:hypothetical protein